MDVFWRNLAVLYQLFDFGDNNFCCCGHISIEVSCGFCKVEVSVVVSSLSLDKGEITKDSLFLDESFSLELFGNFGF
jgi:hypothetical protein